MTAPPVQATRYLQNSILCLFGNEVASDLKCHLARSAAATFCLKVVATLLSFISSVLLARMLRANGYGIYAYAWAWISFLSIPAVLGLDRLLVREIAVYRHQSAWGLLRGLLHWANSIVLYVSTGLALLAGCIAWALAGHTDSQMLRAFLVALPALPLTTLTRLRQAAMQGFHHIVAGQLPEALVQPAFFITLIIGAYLLLGAGLTASWVVGMSVAATAASFLIGAGLLRKILRQSVAESPRAYQTRVWVRSLWPLLVISGVSIVNAQVSILLLGALKGAEMAGVYVVAARGAELIAFAFTAVNLALAPMIANLWAK